MQRLLSVLLAGLLIGVLALDRSTASGPESSSPPDAKPKVVLENLVGNAWKFTGKKPIARIEFGKTEVKGKTVFFVRDNGAGFGMDQASKLFAPFQRLHLESEFEGTGIGLATVHRVIRRHGGEIWADAEVGKGATFYFTLG